MLSSQACYPIAVVGISADLPSGSCGTENLNYQSFFDFLMDGHEAYEKIPSDRFNIDAMEGVNIGEVAATHGAFLKDLDLFDHIEFGISSKDARMMAIGTRRLIELSFLALLDSGMDYRGKNIGAYMASVAHDAWMISGEDETEARGSLAYVPAMVANRVSYHLDLRGPSIPTDTACSSSLSAFHLAAQAIRSGECEAALVGGCQLNYRFVDWLAYTQGGILAPDGKCKPFDASANGFSRGEGAVVVVLKPLERALIDYDHIYATVLGTGINSSGSLAPANSPVASAQRDAMLRAFKQAGRQPQEVDFVELHATGTASGDPTEANWVGESFLKSDNKELLIGSLKGNLGHLEVAAFLASLCKVCSIFQSGIIPPNVNLLNQNPAIRWEDFHLRVPLSPTPLPCQSTSGSSLISLASSGIGGANGHCVVEAPPTTHEIVPFWQWDAIRTPCLLVAGGLSPRSTVAVGESLRTIESEKFPSIATIFGRRSRSMPWRSYAVTSSNSPLRFTEPVPAPRTPRPLVFVFAGQGPQHFEMGRELFNSCTVFQRNILEMDEIHKVVTGFSLIAETGLFTQQAPSAKPLSNPWPIAVTLPALTMLQIATFDALVSLGMKPTAVVGHSAGETALLYASGAGSKTMAMELAIARGQAMTIVEGSQGAMAAVSCSPEQAQEIIYQMYSEQGMVDLDIGCYNTPSAVTLSGLSTDIDVAVERAKAAGFFAKRLNTAVPVHSKWMDPCHDEYKRLVTDIFDRYPSQPPNITTYSTESGTLKTDSYSAEYYWSGTRGPVQFTNAIQHMIQDIGSPDFLEIGPHPALASYLTTFGGESTTVACPLRRSKGNQGEVVAFLDAVGKLAVAGHCCIDFNILNGCSASDITQLPAYPFSRKKVPLYPLSPAIKRIHQHRNGPLNYDQLRINTQTHPYLAEHIIHGEPIMPAAGFIEMILEFGARQLWNVNFLFMLSLSREQPVPIEISTEGPCWSVRSALDPSQSSSLLPNYDRLHAEGYLSLDPPDSVLPPVNIQEIKDRCTQVSVQGFYDSLEHFAQYGKDYQRLLDCYRGTDGERDEVLVQIRGAVGDLPGLEKFKIHPVIFDSAIHVLVHPIFTNLSDKSLYYLPSRLQNLTVHEALITSPFPQSLFAHFVFRQWTPQSMTYDIALLDEDGNYLCTVEAFEVALHGESSLQEPTRRFDVGYEYTSLDLSSCLRPILEELSIPNQARDVSSGDTYAGTLLPPHTVIEYRHGKEMELHAQLLALDVTASCVVYFTALAGSDGDSAIGFVRSLRREYLSWTIYLMVFDRAWTDDNIGLAVEMVSKTPQAELELMVNASGSVHVPRIVSCEAPKNVSPFNPREPWQLKESSVVHCSPPIPDCHSAVVQVQSVNRSDDRLWSFIGRLGSSHKSVMGITACPVGNLIVSPLDSMVDVPGTLGTDASLGPPVIALAVAVLAIGPTYFSNPARFRGEILVTHADTQTSIRIIQLYLMRGFRVTTLRQHVTETEISRLPHGRFQVIVSEYSDPETLNLLSRLLTANGTMFPWKHRGKGLQSLLACDSWLIGNAIGLGLDVASNELDIPMSNISEIITTKAGDPVHVESHLFSPEKAYLLVGGVGSLGVQIAQWMYNNGAREIVLTSRSGRAGIWHRGDTASQRIIAYLETLPDLELRIEAIDALCEHDMRMLMQGLYNPLGGCMLLSMVLADGLFSGLSVENFNAPFKPKVGAFEVLCDIIDIKKLDFLISFSSVSALFGNAGQTNYSAANTMLDARLHDIPNAFSIVTPAITDSFIATINGTRMKHITDWGFSSQRLLQVIDEGIRKLADGPFGYYIPDLDWRTVCANLGIAPMYSHLLPERMTMEDETLTSHSGSSIGDILCATFDIAREDLSPDVPLTVYGLDSLSAAKLSIALKPFFSISQTQLLANVTLHKLEARFEDQQQPTLTEAEQRKAYELQKISEMRSSVAKYTSGFKSPKLLLPSSHTLPDHVVLVTGTTGVVGSSLLECLLRTPQITQIFLLNRAKPGTQTMLERHQSMFQERSLDLAGLDSDKVVYLEGTPGQDYFGLPADTWKELARNITHIVHVAWPVDFTIPLAAFDPAIRGLRDLIDLALSSPRENAPKFLFTSTVGVLSGEALPLDIKRLHDLCCAGMESLSAVEEALVHDPGVAVGSGYIESKWVAEHVLAAAADNTRLKPAIVRVGQLTGGRNGYWKTTEWIPSMIASGYFLGGLPNRSNTMNWLPVDIAAAALAEMLDSPSGVYHLAHPTPVAWTILMQEAARLLNVPLVPYDQWVNSLEKQAASQTAKTSQSNPALRLLEFFRYTAHKKNTNNFLEPELSFAKTLQESPTLRSTIANPLNGRDVGKWIAYWRSIGFIPV